MKPRELLERLAGGSREPEGRVLSFPEQELRTGPPREESLGSATVKLYQKPQDAKDVRRVMMAWPKGFVDLQPTKGLTVGAYEHRGWKPFWEPVRLGIISPEEDDILGDVLIHGERTHSLRWIENFAGCIELLGLSNWGMPYDDPGEGVVLPLHGEASHIPLSVLTVTLSWFSAGGKGSLEFALPESPDESLIPVPWDGMGPEIGVSPLDHDGNFDPQIAHPPLAPGEKLALYFRVAPG